MEQLVAATAQRTPWNKGKLVGRRRRSDSRRSGRSAFAFSCTGATSRRSDLPVDRLLPFWRPARRPHTMSKLSVVSPLGVNNMATFIATDPEGYEAYVGRGSRRLAAPFAVFAGVLPKERVLDVGCGTGHLTREIAALDALATGIDLSTSYVEFARRTRAQIPFFPKLLATLLIFPTSSARSTERCRCSPLMCCPTPAAVCTRCVA